MQNVRVSSGKRELPGSSYKIGHSLPWKIWTMMKWGSMNCRMACQSFWLAGLLNWCNRCKTPNYIETRCVNGWFKHKTPNFVSHECRMHSQLECHIFGIMLTTMNRGRGWHSQFFVKALELALAPKKCHDQSQTFKEVNNRYPGKHLLQEDKRMTLFFFWTSRFQVLQGMLVQNFELIFEELTA